MDIKALIEKRNKLRVDAQALITKETVTTEDRSNFDKMISDADVLSGDITRMQAVENFKQRAESQHPFLRVQASVTKIRSKSPSIIRNEHSPNGCALDR